MQAGCSSAGTGLKRPRTALFPGEFALLLRELISSRSAYVRAQLELVDEDGQLELPVEIVTIWLRCIFATAGDLQAATNTVLLECLAARVSCTC